MSWYPVLTPQVVAQHLTTHNLPYSLPSTHVAYHIFHPDGKKETIDTILQGSDCHIWTQSFSNEWGCLAQGKDAGVRSTDTIDFIHKHEVPVGRDITYATFVINYRPLKSKPHRIRITVAGDKLSYPFDTGSPAASLLETKILIKSTISDAKKGVPFMSADLKDYFLASPMNREEFMRVHLKHFPSDIINRYQLKAKATNDGYIYIRIKKGMYGLKQAAILAYTHLKNGLEPHGYQPVQGTVGLWKHTSRPLAFCLCVDDFGIEYFNKHNVQHLLDCISPHYKYTTDWDGKNYFGLTLDWAYEDGYVDISMPGYVPSALQRLNHKPMVSPQYSPHEHVPIKYGTKGTRQYVSAPDLSPQLSPSNTTWIQSVTGSLLYYGRAIDHTILPTLDK